MWTWLVVGGAVLLLLVLWSLLAMAGKQEEAMEREMQKSRLETDATRNGSGKGGTIRAT